MLIHALTVLLVQSRGGEEISGPSNPENASNVAEWLAGQLAWRKTTIESLKSVSRTSVSPRKRDTAVAAYLCYV